MLKHIVMWKLKDNALGNSKKENMQIIRRSLLALLDIIPELISMEIGEDILHSSMSCDMALVCCFKDIEALNRYKEHPEHVKVSKLIASMRDSRVVVDFFTE